MDSFWNDISNLLFAESVLSFHNKGLGDTSDQDEPTYVDALRGVGVRQIACGSGHTVVLSTEGEVYTWGRGGEFHPWCIARYFVVLAQTL